MARPQGGEGAFACLFCLELPLTHSVDTIPSQIIRGLRHSLLKLQPVSFLTGSHPKPQHLRTTNRLNVPIKPRPRIAGRLAHILNRLRTNLKHSICSCKPAAMICRNPEQTGFSIVSADRPRRMSREESRECRHRCIGRSA